MISPLLKALWRCVIDDKQEFSLLYKRRRGPWEDPHTHTHTRKTAHKSLEQKEVICEYAPGMINTKWPAQKGVVVCTTKNMNGELHNTALSTYTWASHIGNILYTAAVHSLWII